MVIDIETLKRKEEKEAEGDYELIPHEEILKLKKEIDELKRSQGLKSEEEEMEEIVDTDSKTVLISMNKLTKRMEEMITLFKTAGEEMAKGEEDIEEARNSELTQKLNALTQQNKKIATGLLAISEMIKDHFAELPKIIEDRLRPIEETMEAMQSPPPEYPTQNMPPPMGVDMGMGMGDESNLPPPLVPPAPPQ